MVSVRLHPDTLEKALALLAQGARPIAGGTDFMLEPRADGDFFFLDQLDILREISECSEGVWIGASCTFAAIMEDARVPEALRTAVSSIASPAIRNMGTLGGNIKNASPAGDTLPVLYALDAVLALQSLSGMRNLSIQDAITGVKKTSIRPDELIIGVLVPSFIGTQQFHKVGARLAQAISKCSLAAFLRVENDRIQDFRAAFGAVGSMVVRSRDLEEMLVALPLEIARERVPSIIGAYGALIAPVDNARSTAAYRHKVCMNILESFLWGALGQ